MDFQAIVDNIATAACVISVEKLDNGNYGTIRIVTSNKAHRDTIERPVENLTMLTQKYVPNSEYTRYLTRDLNFEDFCYRSAVNKKCLHSYVHPDRYDVWFNMSFIPLFPDDGNLCYCIYIMEVNFEANTQRLSNVSSEIAANVLETCLKLSSAEDFNKTAQLVCSDIRDMCDSEHCCILLMDHNEKTCSILCEAFSDNTKLLPMQTYVDKAFYNIAASWKDTIAGSNCLIAKNEHDMEIVRERNPIWYDSLNKAGAKTIVLFPLRIKDELLGYIWAINFPSDKADRIKETLEVTTYVLSSVIYNNLLLDRMQILSSKDMLTGILNRNEMNNYVDELCSDKHKDSTVSVLFADLNGLKKMNDEKGHTAGDKLLIDAADALREVFDEKCIFRAGGDEFVVIAQNMTIAELSAKAEKLRTVSQKYDSLSFAIGICCESSCKNVKNALKTADELMYEDKRKYYETHSGR